MGNVPGAPGRGRQGRGLDPLWERGLPSAQSAAFPAVAGDWLRGFAVWCRPPCLLWSHGHVLLVSCPETFPRSIPVVCGLRFLCCALRVTMSNLLVKGGLAVAAGRPQICCGSDRMGIFLTQPSQEDGGGQRPSAPTHRGSLCPPWGCPPWVPLSPASS